MKARFDSPIHGEVYVTGSWDGQCWCVESAIDNFGQELDLSREDESRAEDALEKAVEEEKRP
jgi:hypothetical protein